MREEIGLFAVAFERAAKGKAKTCQRDATLENLLASLM